jgi:hypothetical protein
MQKLGWMAGVIDLKGKIITKTNKQRATPQIVLLVESKDFAIIRELSSLTGTNPEMMKEQRAPEWMRRGCREHCPDKHFHTVTTTMPSVARWTLTGAGAAIVLLNLSPYLVNAQKYIPIAYQILQDTPITGQGSTAVVSSIRRLESLGWDLPEKYETALQ